MPRTFLAHVDVFKLLMMEEQKVFFGTSRKLIERIDSLDKKWYVEIWIVKYFFLGIEIHSRKKEIIKHIHENLDNLKVVN